MLTQQELRDKYAMLYEYMATSQKPEYMKAFGHVMSEMMEWTITNKAEMANDYIEKLCSIKWKNYLTQKEAETIVTKMNPKAPWNRDVWNQALDNLGIVKEESPYYNACALWTVMNMVYSDSASTIARIMDMPLAEIAPEDMVEAVHDFALDKLKDSDGVFNVRAYFGL